MEKIQPIVDFFEKYEDNIVNAHYYRSKKHWHTVYGVFYNKKAIFVLRKRDSLDIYKCNKTDIKKILGQLDDNQNLSKTSWDKLDGGEQSILMGT